MKTKSLLVRMRRYSLLSTPGYNYAFGHITAYYASEALKTLSSIGRLQWRPSRGTGQ